MAVLYGKWPVYYFKSYVTCHNCGQSTCEFDSARKNGDAFICSECNWKSGVIPCKICGGNVHPASALHIVFYNYCAYHPSCYKNMNGKLCIKRG